MLKIKQKANQLPLKYKKMDFGPFGNQSLKPDIEFIFDGVLNPAILPKDHALACKIKKNTYIFGGYVRDMIRGVPYTDIDLYIPSREHACNYIHTLRCLGLLREISISDSVGEYSVKKIVVTSPNGTNLKIDIVLPTSPRHNLTKYCDFTVNNLALFADGSIRARTIIQQETRIISQAEATLGCIRDCFSGNLVWMVSNEYINSFSRYNYESIQEKMAERFQKMLDKGFHFHGESITGYQLPIPKTIADLPNEIDTTTCAICREDYHENLSRKNIVLNCNHHFHQDCLSSWRNTNDTCPMCRCIIERAYYNPAISK